MPRTDAMRLQDGERAIKAISEKEPVSLAELEVQLRVVMTGALALQSLDDLGSDEANEKAWEDMTTLGNRAEVLRERIATLKSAEVLQPQDNQLVELKGDDIPVHLRNFFIPGHEF